MMDLHRSENTCPVCASTSLRVFLELPGMPIHCNWLLKSRKEAFSCARGNIRLAFCEQCSFITNICFEPGFMKYDRDYENSLHHSARFQAYALESAQGLIDRYQLFEKNIIEIGSGSGDFLILLSHLGKNRGLGFDPSYVPRFLPRELNGRVDFIQDYFSESYANLRADLVFCRQTLEHLQNPKELLQVIHSPNGGKDGKIVFFEVPNAKYMLEKLAIWDIIYEHCSYFTPESLRVMFNQCGFVVDEVKEAFDRQYLTLYARCGKGYFAQNNNQLQTSVEEIARLVNCFALKYQHKVNQWRSKLKLMAEHRSRVVAWGAGSKGVTFLNLTMDQNPIDFIVDVNRRKHGKYIAGTGQEIVQPEFLKDYRPDVVIVMNPIYENEIRKTLQSIGLTPRLLCVTD